MALVILAAISEIEWKLQLSRYGGWGHKCVGRLFTDIKCGRDSCITNNSVALAAIVELLQFIVSYFINDECMTSSVYDEFMTSSVSLLRAKDCIVWQWQSLHCAFLSNQVDLTCIEVRFGSVTWPCLSAKQYWLNLILR